MRILPAAVAALVLNACAGKQQVPAASAPVSTSTATSTSQAPEIREGNWAIRDTNLFVRDVGPVTAPPLVIVHGGPGGNYLSLQVFESLAPAFRVVLYDQRGTGESDRFPIAGEDPQALARLSAAENVEDLEALRQKLGAERLSLLGHSWGGALAVLYAAAYPEHVEKLVVYSGGPEDQELAGLKRKAHNGKMSAEERDQMKQRFKALQGAAERSAPQDELDSLFGGVAGVMFPALYCARPTQASAAQGRAGFWASQGAGDYIATFDRKVFAPKLQAIKAKALLTWGRCEPSPQERLLYLLDNLPDAQFVTFEKSGHNAVEEEHDLFMQTVQAFLTDKELPTKAYRSRAEIPAQ